ncbi:peptidoglycan-associated lipoprotein Pal [Thioalkalivibrio thiocyanodenitrificans]|uniref:peptidoglycan-associated lipoprotein Pal n=1 Tax=Thioalkalivibrio thiocyanodenitrificans TaxID=243063 RepID=UPI00037FF0EA|nr:peptidoglycan-associated lipoprotein Pal [Thioalkalivibrio thiocyanodenitrificans]
MKSTLQILFVLVLAFALGACAKATRPGDEDPAAVRDPSARPDTGIETMPLDPDGRLFADPLDDPDSPLAERIVYFEFDRSDIRAEYEHVITAHGQYLADNPGVRVRAEGHTDERGTREYNLGLGERRAQSVQRMLMLQGARADQIQVISYGEEVPAAFGRDEESWARNRRVELVYDREGM